MRLISPQTQLRRREVHQRYPGSLLMRPTVCNAPKTGIYTLGSMVFGGPGSGRHKETPTPDRNAFLGKRARSGVDTIFNWVMHPTKGPLFDNAGHGSHAEWFKEMGLPDWGPKFDAIERGTVAVYQMPDLHKTKKVDVDSYQYDHAPEEIHRAFSKSFPEFDDYDRTDSSSGAQHRSIAAGGPGSGRKPEFRTTPKDPNFVAQPGGFLKQLFHGGQSYVKWAEHPTQGVVFDTYAKGDRTHTAWFDAMGLPSSGEAYDKINRGEVTVNHFGKEVNVSSYQGTVPGEVEARTREAYPNLNDYTWKSNAAVEAVGTSEGAVKGWDTRGRKGRVKYDPVSGVPISPAMQKEIDEQRAFDKAHPKTVAFYHGTASALKDAILKEGLIPGKGKGGDAWAKEHFPGIEQTHMYIGDNQRPASVYMSLNKHEAMNFASLAASEYPGSQPVLFKVDVPVIPETKGKFIRDEATDPRSGDIRFQGKIPPEWIHYVGTTKDTGYAERATKQIANPFPGIFGATQKTVYLVILAKPDQVDAYGTSEGADRAWDTRGRGRKGVIPNVRQPAVPATPEGVTPATQENPQVQLKPTGKMQQTNPDVSFQPSDRMLLALQNMVLCGKEKQAEADRMEQHLSKALGIPRTSDNKPFDLTNGKVGVEVKCAIDQKNSKITMSKAALARKMEAVKQTGVKGYTVLADKRGGNTQYYVKQGFGSFRVGSMTQVTLPDLKKMLGGGK